MSRVVGSILPTLQLCKLTKHRGIMRMDFCVGRTETLSSLNLILKMPCLDVPRRTSGTAMHQGIVGENLLRE